MAERSHNIAADDRANDADHHIHKYAVSSTTHDLARDPTRDDPNNDPPEYKHIFSSLELSFADGCDVALQCTDQCSRTMGFWLG
jgi:hypothetical protein